MGVTRQSHEADARRPSKLRQYLGAFGLLVLAAGPVQGALDDGTTVRDLYYREVLFQYYQQDYFTAITHLLAAQKQARIESDRVDTELLRVAIELSYGLHQNALEIFKRNLSVATDASALDRIWLSLAKTWERRGYPERAQDALISIGNGLGKEGRAEQALLQAQLLMDKQRYEEAATTLSAAQAPPEWSPYLRFNQAVALQQSGQTAAGTALLDELGQLKSTDMTLLALRDKANLTLGFAYLGNKQAEAAKAVLGRIRLNSPFSTLALLGLGWAEYGLGNVSQALKSWSELTTRDVKDAAVHEAEVMVPFAQWQLHAFRDAVMRYRAVIDAYDVELARLDEVIALTDRGTLISDLVGSDTRTDLDILPARIADSQTRTYFLALLASDGFREAFTTYRNLRSQQRQLEVWMGDMSAYADMLATRRYAYESRLPQVQSRLQEMDWRALEAWIVEYAGVVDAIAVKQDAFALANGQEQRQLSQLEQIEARLARWPQARELDQQRLRTRVLKGLLQWEIESHYAPRLWEARKGINGLRQEFSNAMEQRSLLAMAQVEAPKRFEGYDVRIAALNTRIAALRQRLATAIQRHERFLQSLVHAELDRHKRELQTYRLEASYALARLLDEIATGIEGQN